MATRRSARQAARRRSGRAQRGHSGRRQILYSRTLRYEPLEVRRLLALVTVDTPLDIVDIDDGLTSLREAIFATNLVSGPDEIAFDFGHDGPETIVLTQGELRITDDLTIEGLGAELLTIDASGNDPTPDINDGRGSRIFNIDDGSLIEVSIAGVTLTGGDTATDGGAVLSVGRVTILDSVITGNSSVRNGGGIFGRGDLVVEGTTISHNSGRFGGGLYGNTRTLTLTACTIVNNVAEFRGGGIYTLRTMTVANSTISHNSAAAGLGGGIHAGVGITIASSTISYNSAAFGGGGIFMNFGNTGNTTLTNSTMSGNSTGGSGGGILSGDAVTLTNSTINENSAGESGGAVDARRVTLTNSLISGNVAEYRGGGVHANSSFMATDSVVAGNSAQLGGGVYAFMPTVTQCTISDNSAESSGGGIYAEGAVTLINSTVNGNKSSVNGGGIWTRGGMVANSTISGNSSIVGAGIYSYSGSPRIDHSTIALNTAAIGGGVFIASGTLTLNHTILASNSATNGSDVQGLIGASATARYSLIGVGGAMFAPSPTGSPDANGNLIWGNLNNPRLAPLADNGGPTKTHALFADSPAIDAGDPMAVAGVGAVPEFDQRGPEYSRIFGSRIDIGAIERQNVGSAMQLIVDTLVDELDDDRSSGDLSLREAVALTNGNAGFADTISFDPTLAGGSIVLRCGELAINDALTISGLGADLLTIDASGSDPTPDENNGDGSRIFSVETSRTSDRLDVAMSGLRLTGGDSLQGGAILFSPGGMHTPAKLTLWQCTVDGNSSSGPGGGISGANVFVTGSKISGNMAKRDGGGLYGSSFVLTDCTISGNSAGGNGGGIQAGGRVAITNCIIVANSASNGGGIFVTTLGSVTVTASNISNNLARFSGGGIYGGAFGGVSVTASTISGNTAVSGGGIAARSAAVIDSSIIHNMASGNGGGIYSDIFFSSDRLVIFNSTISHNTAGNHGGGIYRTGSRRPATIEFSTISKNVAGITGGGIWGRLRDNPTAVIANSIVADNSTTSGDNSDLDTSQLTVRHSLIGDASGSGLAEAPIGMPDADGNLVGGPMHGTIDPRLGPLAANGGPTRTHALLPGSPAIDAGDPAAMVGVGGVPLFDQRGAPFTRVHGGRIDIGAFEAQPNPLTGDYNFNGLIDTADVVVWRKTLGSTTDLRADGNGDGVVNQDDWQVWQANFGRTAASEEQGAGSVGQEAVDALPQRPAWQPPASPGVSLATSRPAFRPAIQRVSPQDNLLAALASPRSTSHLRNDFIPERRPVMRDTDSGLADASIDAVDRVFATLGVDVAGTGHSAPV